MSELRLELKLLPASRFILSSDDSRAHGNNSTGRQYEVLKNGTEVDRIFKNLKYTFPDQGSLEYDLRRYSVIVCY